MRDCGSTTSPCGSVFPKSARYSDPWQLVSSLEREENLMFDFPQAVFIFFRILDSSGLLETRVISVGVVKATAALEISETTADDRPERVESEERGIRMFLMVKAYFCSVLRMEVRWLKEDVGTISFLIDFTPDCLSPLKTVSRNRGRNSDSVWKKEENSSGSRTSTKSMLFSRLQSCR